MLNRKGLKKACPMRPSCRGEPELAELSAPFSFLTIPLDRRYIFKERRQFEVDLRGDPRRAAEAAGDGRLGELEDRETRSHSGRPLVRPMSFLAAHKKPVALHSCWMARLSAASLEAISSPCASCRDRELNKATVLPAKGQWGPGGRCPVISDALWVQSGIRQPACLASSPLQTTSLTPAQSCCFSLPPRPCRLPNSYSLFLIDKLQLQKRPPAKSIEPPEGLAFIWEKYLFCVYDSPGFGRFNCPNPHLVDEFHFTDPEREWLAPVTAPIVRTMANGSGINSSRWGVIYCFLEWEGRTWV